MAKRLHVQGVPSQNVFLKGLKMSENQYVDKKKRQQLCRVSSKFKINSKGCKSNGEAL